MTKIVCALPNWQSPLAQGLANHGLDVEHLWASEPGGDYAHIVPIAGVDLLKAMKATGAEDVLLELFRQLPANASQSAALFEGVIERKPDAVVVGYSADPLGRAALAAARYLGVPSIECEHGVPVLATEDAWFIRENHADIILAAGEHSRRWWAKVAPDADVRVVGNPQWDQYAGTRRRQRTPGDVPTVLWVSESGAHAWQSPRVWQFRSAPQRAWSAFQAAILGVAPKDARVLVKLRQGENEQVRRGWEEDAAALMRDYGIALTFTDAPMAAVLPHVDLVVAQQSNALVESLLSGAPVVNLTRPGVSLLEEVPSLSILDEHLEDRLAEKIREGLFGSEWTEQRCKDTASHYHVNDGGAVGRVAAAVQDVAAGKPARELALA